ncbi:type I polyketide synthase [Candidatus Odyssella acanthamoebae]|uniref:type I polyketide synthase n=1 Tax=Candidatus Odyssella acanthamoebae TaxID=91604 RepID=UPI00068C15AE|nr:type I polyketide synthase [Candidatus Paracaedibacter acanthamoebae]
MNNAKPYNIGENDIAVVGIAGKFPGASTPEELWKNLIIGKESITFFTKEELLAQGISNELIEDPNYVRAMPILKDEDKFDAQFFGYTPQEAALLDPQQRLFLECAYQALEDAGCNPEVYKGLIGVFGGARFNSYILHNNNHINFKTDFLPTLFSSTNDFLCTRVCYKLNLKGPGVTVQTACSTSLVAVHMACQSLLNYETDICLAGGVAIQVPQVAGYLYENNGIYSKDGHCRTFDASASGTIFGSGCGVVVLKRLSDALANNDSIYMVIKGSAINNDGSNKVNYSSPGVEGQTLVILEAIEASGINPETISYVEAHGTGTLMGDPVEIHGLTKAFRSYTQKRQFCAIGSIKSNIGHLDIASGIAGLIKLALAFKNKTIPPSINYEVSNPNIDFKNSPFFVITKATRWESENEPVRAGISSFGVGSTNVHIILEEPPRQKSIIGTGTPQLLLVSAKTPEALEESAKRFGSYIKQNPDESLANVAYTTHIGRMHYTYRKFVVCDSHKKAAQELLESQRITYLDSKNPSIIFMFPGQGAEYVNMGQELYHTEPNFSKHVNVCFKILEKELNINLQEILYPNPSKLEEAQAQIIKNEFAQISLFVVVYALAQLWISWGIQPKAMIGHSLGEYVAACLAGVLTIEDALKLVALRGRLMDSVPPGKMLAVFVNEKQIQEYLNEELYIAAVNSTENCVVSGSGDSIERLQIILGQKGILYQLLNTSHAFHSLTMEPILEEYNKILENFKFDIPKIRYISNLTGCWITPEAASSTQYYQAHLRYPVRFSDGLDLLFQEKNLVLLEVGPGNALASFALQHANRKENHVILNSLASVKNPQKASEKHSILTALGGLWLKGVKVDWDQLHKHEQLNKTHLPTYPFQRKRFWLDSSQIKPKNGNQFSLDLKNQPYPGVIIDSPILKENIIFESYFSKDWPLYIKDHRIGGLLVVAGGSHLSMTIAAINLVFNKEAYLLKNVIFSQALTIKDNERRKLQLVMPADLNAVNIVRLYSYLAGEEGISSKWVQHFEATLEEAKELTSCFYDEEKIKKAFSTEISANNLYELINKRSVVLGPSFQWIKRIYCEKGEAFTFLDKPHGDLGDLPIQRQFHAGLIDNCLQTLMACLENEIGTFLPFTIENLIVYAHSTGPFVCHAKLLDRHLLNKGIVKGNIELYENTGKLLAKFEGVFLKKNQKNTILDNFRK